MSKYKSRYEARYDTILDMIPDTKSGPEPRESRSIDRTENLMERNAKESRHKVELNPDV